MMSRAALDLHLMSSSLIPPAANQGWTLALCEGSRPIKHDHKFQRQLIIVVEGVLVISSESKAPVTLRSGDLIQMDPGITYTLSPERSSRFFTIDLPEDVSDFLPTLDASYFGLKIELGDYTVYELVSGEKAQGKWSVALLEIQDSPKHYHLIERELFVVVSGTLDIEIDGKHQTIAYGESIKTTPRNIHQLKSANQGPVRVLCFNFPAFSPTDMYCVQ